MVIFFGGGKIFSRPNYLQGQGTIFRKIRNLALSVQASLSVCKFSLCYPHRIHCLVMRIK